jgi:hypothetical protein
MLRVCEQQGVQLMTAYRKYYEPSTLYLKKLIHSGRLGKIDVINTAFSELHVAGRSLPWLLDAQTAGGGPLMDLGVYCVNTSRWLVEENPVEVSAHSWKKDVARFRSVEEGISFRMHFASGLVVQGSSTYSCVLSSFLFVQGDKGWACLSPAFPFDEERRLTGKVAGKWFERKFKVLDEFAPELDALATAVRTAKSVEPDGRQGHPGPSQDVFLPRIRTRGLPGGRLVSSPEFPRQQRRHGHNRGCNREGPRQYRRAAWARSQSHTESEARARGPRKLARFFNESEGFLLFENHGFAVTPRRGNVPAPDLWLPLRRFRHDSAD